MTIEILTDYTLKRGDTLTLHAYDNRPNASIPEIYAHVEYLGRSRFRRTATLNAAYSNAYMFESTTYGWLWYMNAEQTEIWNERDPAVHYAVDNRTGWLNHLPK